MAILHRYQGSTLGPGFFYMATLDIPRENDQGIFRYNFTFVDMAQGPVVIAFGFQIIDTAWCIIFMPFTAGQGTMQHADIERVGIMLRVVCCQVFSDSAGRITLAVDAHLETLNIYRLGLLRGEECYIFRKGHGPGNLTGRIVITGNDKYLDAGPVQPAHPAREKESGIVILPVAIIKITGN